MHRIILYIVCAISISAHAYHKTTLLDFEPHEQLDEHLNQFLEPIVFTQHGFERFFTYQYNTRRYAQEFLPCCFVHVLDFLSHALTTEDPHTFAIGTCDIFHQRLKDVTWVNPYALVMLLEHLPDNLASLCAPPHQEDAYRAIVYEEILHNFNVLKHDPDTFLDATAAQIKQQEDTQRIREQLRYRATRCIESALDKLIWSPHEQISTWRTFLAIGKHLESLYQHHIIPDETSLNHMIWSLIYRYGHFLEYAGLYVSEETYAHIRKELEDDISFLGYEELEAYMTSKKAYLIHALSHGYAQSLARKQAII